MGSGRRDTDDFTATQGGPVIYGSLAWDDPKTANTIIQASLPPFGLDSRTTMMVGYGVSAARGTWAWDSSKDQAVLTFDLKDEEPLHQVIEARATKIAGAWSSLTDTTGLYANTWHPCGGASMMRSTLRVPSPGTRNNISRGALFTSTGYFSG